MTMVQNGLLKPFEDIEELPGSNGELDASLDIAIANIAAYCRKQPNSDFSVNGFGVARREQQS